MMKNTLVELITVGEVKVFDEGLSKDDISICVWAASVLSSRTGQLFGLVHPLSLEAQGVLVAIERDTLICHPATHPSWRTRLGASYQATELPKPW